jgi:ABC-type polysaccharide/polyol phosphate transport system ATPase subunit
MDEFFGGVGDERFKEKANEVFKKVLIEGRTIIHVSHGMKTIKEHCDRVVLMEDGKIHSIGEPEEIIKIYRELSKKPKLRG